MTSLARTLVTIAARTLPEDRLDWGYAMHAEFEAASKDGRATAFAIGCVTGSVRANLDRPEGRMSFTRSALALVTLVPLATFHVGCSYGSFRFALGRPDHFYSAFAAGDTAQRHIAASYASSAPLIGVLLLALAGAHLAAIWYILNWNPKPLRRAIAAGLLAAVALTVTIVSVMGAPTGAAVQFAGTAVEMALLAAFALWARHIAANRTDRSPFEEWI